jgi:hypothetical protein
MANPTEGTNPDYPDRGAQRVSLARFRKCAARDINTTTVDLNFQTDDELRGMLGRWIEIELDQDAGYYFMSVAEATEFPSTNPSLAARSGDTRCGKFTANRPVQAYITPARPILRITTAATTVARLYDAET